MKWVDGFFISNSAHVCQVVQREMKENKIKERSCKQWANIKNRTTFCNYWGRKAATWDLRICWKIFFYTGNIIYIEQRNLRCITIFTDNSHLEDLKTRVLECRFQLSEMHKSWIPKPNKPGKMRPITPCKKDLIVMEALSLLLNIVYEDVFLTNSHGFRKGRGPITFFAHVDSWGTVDRFIKADIVGCFDNIDHTLLNRRIGLDMGESSEGFCNSIFQLYKGNKR